MQTIDDGGRFLGRLHWRLSVVVFDAALWRGFVGHLNIWDEQLLVWTFIENHLGPLFVRAKVVFVLLKCFARDGIQAKVVLRLVGFGFRYYKWKMRRLCREEGPITTASG